MKLSRQRLSIVSKKQGITYFIRDLFTDTRTSGSVNNTSATPGPGIRVVTDTGDNLSIGDGKANITTTAGSSDPRIIYSSTLISRRAGQMGFFTIGSTNGRWKGGWHEITVLGTRHAYGVITGTTNLGLWNGASSIYYSADIVTNVDYQCCIVLRNSSGAFYLVKGGSFTNWELIFVGSQGSNTAFYIGHSAILNSYTCNKITAPSNRFWLPTPVVSDGMSELVNTDGLGHAEGVADTIGRGGNGVSWTDQIGTWQVSSGSRSASALSGGNAICAIDSGTNNSLITLEVTRSAGNAGGVARYSDSANHLLFYLDGTNAKLDQVVSGTTTNLISSVATYSAEAELRLVLESNSKARLYYNDLYVGKTTLINASLTSTLVGIYTTDTGNAFDNFYIYVRGTGSEYSDILSLGNRTVPIKTVSVPDGADISTYILQMNSGDSLELALNGSYTFSGGVKGFVNIPSGYPTQRTKINGNNATITGGQNGVYLLGKQYIDFENVNFADQTQYCVTYDNCDHVTQAGCTYQSTLGNDFVDALKIFRSDDLEFTNCEILPTTGLDTCDGFEFWGPCNRVILRNCIAHDITGTVTSPDHHGFEVYGNTAGEECESIQFINCTAYNCDVGFSVEGGSVGNISHTNIFVDGCSSYDNNHYGYQGVQGSTLYRRNASSGTNTGNGTAETNGNVTDLS